LTIILEIPTPVLRLVHVVGLSAALCLAGAPDAGARDASHTSTRPWIHEEEFGNDRTLRATPDKVVILHLGATGSIPMEHRIPYRFKETGPFTFCIPADDPHLLRMTLVSVSRGTHVVEHERGGDCVHRTIEAGRYDMTVTHDGSAIDAHGKTAFIHIPRRHSRPRAPASDTISRTGEVHHPKSHFVLDPRNLCQYTTLHCRYSRMRRTGPGSSRALRTLP